MPTILPTAKTTFLGPNGEVLAGGSVAFSIPGTATPKNTYQDPNQTILNTNPVQLDANGQALIWGTGQYRQQVYDANNNLIWDQITEDTTAALLGNMTNEEGSGGTPGFAANVDFTPGTTTSLTLSTNYGSAANLWVAFDSAEQGADSYSLNGTTLTFSAVIPVGVQKVYVKGGSTIAIGAPGSSTVTDATVATNAGIQSSKLSFTQAGTGAVARTVLSKLQERLSAADFNAKGDGITDDTAALSAAINEANVLGTVVQLTPGSTYIISAALPPITTTGAGLECTGGGGDNQNDAGCVIKATGTAGYTMVTLSSIIGQRKTTHLRFKGIALDCNSIAGIGLSITSIDYSDISVVGWNAKTEGVFIGCVNGALLTDPQDTQRNTISIVWQQITVDVPCVLMQNGSTGNPSFNLFPLVAAVNAAPRGVQAAFVWIGTDNNIYENFSVVSPGTYSGIFQSSNAAPNFGSSNELFLKVSSNKPVYVQGGGSYSNPSMIRVIEYDEANSTPTWHADLGTGLIDPAWHSYFPTLTFSGGGGSFSSVTAQYRRSQPTTVDWKVTFTCASAGTGTVQVPTPTTRTGIPTDAAYGQEISVTGKAVTGNIAAGGGTANLNMMDGTNILANYVVVAGGAYQCNYQDVFH